MVLFGDIDRPLKASRGFVSISWASCLSYRNCSVSSTSLPVLCQPLSKLDSFVRHKNFLVGTFNCLASDEVFKKASCIASQTWYQQGFQRWRARWPCFFWIICRQFACQHCWATRAVCTETYASRWICCSVRQQSVCSLR